MFTPALEHAITRCKEEQGRYPQVPDVGTQRLGQYCLHRAPTGNPRQVFGKRSAGAQQERGEEQSQLPKKRQCYRHIPNPSGREHQKCTQSKTSRQRCRKGNQCISRQRCVRMRAGCRRKNSPQNQPNGSIHRRNDGFRKRIRKRRNGCFGHQFPVVRQGQSARKCAGRKDIPNHPTQKPLVCGYRPVPGLSHEEERRCHRQRLRQTPQTPEYTLCVPGAEVAFGQSPAQPEGLHQKGLRSKPPAASGVLVSGVETGKSSTVPSSSKNI